jgi:hypothetical protein
MTKSISTQRTTVTLPGVSDINTPSIRQIMLKGILTGAKKEDIKAEVAKFHAGSAGDVKFAKHYSWYKVFIKKNPTDKTVTMYTIPESAE